MEEVRFQNRRAVQIENDFVRLTAVVEGGHIAEITHKTTGVNPLWIPPWPSIEPSDYSVLQHPEYGIASEGRLLSGILGHNLCLDLFGPPSEEESAAGIPIHGEANVVEWTFIPSPRGFTGSCDLPAAQLKFERRVQLNGQEILFDETVENISSLDRPVAWTEHVTFGPPFLEHGVTEFRAPATRSRTAGSSYVDFDWPLLPKPAGQFDNLERYTSASSSGGFTSHLMDPNQQSAYFVAYSPTFELLLAYMWHRQDFPWLGIWEENRFRTHPPWNARTVTRGMEFGVSPFAETRREMIDRNQLFGRPCYRWIPAKTKVSVQYQAVIRSAKSIPNHPTELFVAPPASSARNG